MLSALQLPKPDLILAAAARVQGSEKAVEALTKGLRIYDIGGCLHVSSFTDATLYKISALGCDCKAKAFIPGPCKHEVAVHILEIAQTLSASDLEAKADVPATMPRLTKQTAEQSAADLFGVGV